MTMRFSALLSVTLALVSLAAPRLAAQTLVSYYSFDSGTMTTAGSSILSVVGTGVGGQPLSPMGTNPTVDSSGQFGSAANFSGALGLESNTFGTGSTTIGNNFSISFWMKTPDVTASASSYVFQTGADSGAPQNAILFGYVSGKAELYATSGGDPRPVSGITLSPSLNNTWINLVYTYDGSTLKGYLNGAETFSTNVAFSMTAAGGLSVGGARNGAGTVPGSLDDFAIWNGVLSSSQVTQLQTSDALSVSAIPEPSTYAAIFGACALGLAAWRRRGQFQTPRKPSASALPRS